MNRSLLFILILASAAISANAQFLVRGNITDAVSKEPLEYANVTEKDNYSNTAVTDKWGNFLIKVKDRSAAIVSTFMGYKTSEVNIEGKNEASLKIELIPSTVNLKDVVVAVSSGRGLSTIAKADLNLKPVKSTQELLRIVPGLFIAQHAGGGKAEQIFLRGFDCDHGTDIQVSVDGMPVNMVSHAHGQGYADAHFIIPETINSIDYGTGPYYANHGNLNTAGYVNFATYANIPASRVQLEAGNFNTYRALALFDVLKRNKEKQSAYIAGELNYTNGPTLNPQNFTRLNLFAKYNLSLSSTTRLSISSSAFRSKWDASGQVPMRAVKSGLIDRFGSIDPTEGGNTERYNVNLHLYHNFSNGVTWEHRAYYTRNIFNLYSNFTFYLKDPVSGDEINQAEKRNLLGYETKLEKKSIYEGFTLSSVYGGGFRYDAMSNSYLSHVAKRKFLDYIKRGNIKELNSYAYLQQQLNIDKWVFNAGVRFDNLYFNYKDKLSEPQLKPQSKAIISPKVKVEYIVNQNMQLYVKAGKGFHSNDARVVVANAGKEILPAAYGADLGIVLKPVSPLFINIALWYLKLNQEFVYVGDDGIIEPGGKTVRRGLDIIARWQLTPQLFANANFNFTKARAMGEAKGFDFIPLAPAFTTTGGIFYKRKQGINAALSYRLIKDRPANSDNTIKAQGYFLLDCSVNYTKPKYEIGISAENMLNVKWNEAQFATESRLMNEVTPVTELHFTPGTPLSIRAKLAVFF